MASNSSCLIPHRYDSGSTGDSSPFPSSSLCNNSGAINNAADTCATANSSSVCFSAEAWALPPLAPLPPQQPEGLVWGGKVYAATMVRKRTAAELDLHEDASADYAHQRFSRRAHAATGSPTFVGDLGGPPSLLLPTLNIESSNAGAGPPPLLPSPGGLQRLPPPSAPPPVCGFSGLPLFQSELDRGDNDGLPLVASSADDGSSSNATAWIDGIIRELITSSSTEVSIPQLIQNVREVVHPCNPNLAAVLEYRLRSLTSSFASLADHHQHSLQLQGTPLTLPAGIAELPVKRSEVRLPQPAAAAVLVQPTSRRSPANQFLNWEANHTQLHSRVAAPAAPPNNSLPHSSQQQQHRPQQNQQYPTQQPAPPPLLQQQQEPEQQSSATTEETAAVAAAAAQAAAAVATREKKEELRKQKRDEEGLHLLTLLLQCAEAVSADNLEEANRMLLEISELSTPFGTSAQRIAAYFSEAMSARLVSSCLGIYAPLPPAAVHRQKLAAAYQVFNGISPFVKFSHFTANQAIQEAFEREERVHIIDLDIMQGLQWPGLFHILASRPGGPPYVRLTGLGTSMDALEATGKRLTDFAETLGLPFEFYPVAEKAGNLDPERLHVSKREAVAVHWLHHSLYDVTGSDANTLWLLQR